MDSYYIQRIKSHSEFWSFFEGRPEYDGQSADDFNCKRWQDTIKVAYLIFINESEAKFKCKPGEISVSFADEWRGHDSEIHEENYDNTIKIISKTDYDLMLNEHLSLPADCYTRKGIYSSFLPYKKAMFDEYLEEGYFAVKHGGYQTYDIAASIKGIDGYFLISYKYNIWCY